MSRAILTVNKIKLRSLKSSEHINEKRGMGHTEVVMHQKVQVGKDQEKAQSEKDSHSKNRGGKNQTNNQVLIP